MLYIFLMPIIGLAVAFVINLLFPHVVSWVLTPFNDEQQKLMDDAFDTSVKIIDDFIAGRDSQYLMNKYN